MESNDVHFTQVESKEAARSEVEPLQNQQRLLFGCHGSRWLSFQTLQKQFWLEGWQSHKPCARLTKSKPCGADWLLHNLLTSIFWTVAMVPHVTCRNVCSCWRPGSAPWTVAIVLYDTRRATAAGFVEVQPGFLQLLLTQTWVKRTALDSSRCVVYIGIKFKAIRAASKKLEQDEWWKYSFTVFTLCIVNFYRR